MVNPCFFKCPNLSKRQEKESEIERKKTRDLCYKNMTIVNDATSWSVTLESSIMLLESSIKLLENIYSSGVTHDDCHLRMSYFYSTDHRDLFYNHFMLVIYNCKRISCRGYDMPGYIPFSCSYSTLFWSSHRVYESLSRLLC